MSIPEGHSLIRIRDGKFTDLIHAVAPFDDGFLVPADHPVAEFFAMRDDASGVTATVASTDEFLWSLSSYKFFRNEFGSWFRAEFAPFVESFRESTFNDDAWLKWAEQQAA